ncbi:MAG: transglycosylase SLT domain-containing protein [Gammaproteobacteria bacterium]|jgi:soluble lytic murein transglycosylase
MRYIGNRMKQVLFFVCTIAVFTVDALADSTPKTDSAISLPVSVATAATLDASAPIALLESNLTELKRALFQDAVEALENGDLDTFNSLKAQSTDYILYPYLAYYDLRNRLSSATDEELMSFIETYSSIPLSYRIRTQWLYRLAEDQRWKQYLKVYKQQGGAKLRCAYLHARLATDKARKTYKSVMLSTKKLWVVGKKQPAECDYVFSKFEKSKYISTQLIWDRIENAIKKGNTKLALDLSKKLGSRDRKQVELWVKVHKNPGKYLKSKKLRKRSLVNRKIIIHGVKRFARRDAEKAREYWSKLQHSRGFGRKDLGEMQRYIALRSSYQRHPKAYEWLSEINKEWVNDDVLYWRAMSALRMQDWKALERNINDLPKKEKQEPKWQYWLARTLEQLGEKEQAVELFKEIATQTNYYGFISADRIGATYSFNMEPLSRDEKVIGEIAQIPGVQRAKELYLVNQQDDARREWARATRKFKSSKLKQAALLSHDWEWHHNAILTVAKTPHRSDYDVRFPTPFKELVFNNANAHDMDPSLIYGVARRESAFRPNARSSVGALGLMQLMPGTARLESKLLGRNRPTYSEILEAENNILLGSSYLNRMLERFGGNQALATAAYNAGPRRVDSWIPETDAVSSDIWVDTLPFKETREYVRAVLAYSTIFDWKLDQNITTISSRMYDEISKDALTALNSIN